MTTQVTNKASVTPMMQQYFKIREKLPSNTMLLFRLGDFYELFHKDAYEASKILDITLTHRHNIPMAGIPCHAAESYINKLLRAGVRVAIGEQMETPQPGKLVRRDITRILTPGTILQENQLSSTQNHYLLSFNIVKEQIHASWVDLSTGGFAIASDPNPKNLLPIFMALDPKEVIIPEMASETWKTNKDLEAFYQEYKDFMTGRPVSTLPDYVFDPIEGAKNVMDALGVLNLQGFGINKEHPALGPAAAIISYATDNLCSPPKNLRALKEYKASDALLIDTSTLRNLEIFKSSIDYTRKGTLIESMDRTVTAAGARLLHQYLSTPNLDQQEILRRQDCVGEFMQNPSVMNDLRDVLKKVRDLSRIISRLQNRMRNPRELGAIRDTLNQFPFIFYNLSKFEGNAVKTLSNKLEHLEDLAKTLNLSIVETLPAKTQDGGYIRKGFDPELDRIRSLSSNNKTWITEFEMAERQRTGIKSLRVKYNNSFGYFLEITRSYLHLVPDDYIRQQTMTNTERYTTEELKKREKEIRDADQISLTREEEIFRNLVERTLEEAHVLLKNAEVLAQVDLFTGWATLALEWDYCKPTIDDSDKIEIQQGRHPVVEQMLRKERLGIAGTHSFVPNDTKLKADEEQIALITGPNMAGKSTYIRQVALITLMAQVGSWVPAQACHIGLVDRIFSRVGASDELARGNSTFMVEMNETANILNNCTNRSLIILDEIGRGTSTYDGLSIAWSVVEYLHNIHKNIGPRTLFATHYHEITKLENTLPRLRNYSAAVKEQDDQIIFVRQIIPIPADRSYGIQVARLAGLPAQVVTRAKEILHDLETEGNILQQQLLRHKNNTQKEIKNSDKPIPQMSLF